MTYQKIDNENMYGAIYDFPDHISDASRIGTELIVKNIKLPIQNVIIAGMGGSAIGGDILRVLIKDEIKIPLFVSRHYVLPTWVDENTLVICSSYSGNTEETLSSYDDAINKGAQLFGVTTGGELCKRMEKDNVEFVLIPTGLQPRAALAYSLIPMLYLFNKVGFISKQVCNYLNNVITLLSKKRMEYSKENSNNKTFELAKQIHKKIPIIYGEVESTNIIALRLKGQLCENAKMIAYHNELPEMNHNEIVGWENNSELLNHFAIIWIKDQSDQERVKLRQKITSNILQNLEISQFSIEVSENQRIVRLFHLIHFGDWLSYWCAILNETDPSPVANINRLKSELDNL